jgi:hypothetical protein
VPLLVNEVSRDGQWACRASSPVIATADREERQMVIRQLAAAAVGERLTAESHVPLGTDLAAPPRRRAVGESAGVECPGQQGGPRGTRTHNPRI